MKQWRWFIEIAMRQRRWFIGGIVVIVAAIGLIIGLQLSTSDGARATANKGGATVEVTRGDISQTLTVYGEVVPKQEYTFTFDGDKVSKILVSVGQRVEPDQVLVELNRTREELALLQAERALQEAQAEGIPVVIREKELAYQMALQDYEQTTLHAPFAGVVTKLDQATTSSENWSLVLIDTSELYVEADVDQLDAPDVSVGQMAEALIEPLPDRAWTVEIIEVGGMAVARGNSNVVAVTGKLPQPDPSILVGYTVEMEITTASAIDVLTVPISSLIESPRGWMVMKVVNGEASPQQVTIGVTSDTYAEITSGLEEGDLVLLNSASPSATQPERTSGESRPRPQGGFPGMP